MDGSVGIDAVLFDLADVLLDCRGPESLARLSAGRVSPGEFGRFWAKSPCADAFYRGRCSPEAFAIGAVQAFQLTLTEAEFLQDFRMWLQGPYPGAFDLVAQVRERAVVACLSNTNCLDVERFRNELRLHERFDYCFFSNEMGTRKPEEECYRDVLAELRCQRPERVVLLDDSLACVEGARRIGIQAFVVRGVADVRDVLATLGFQDGSTGGGVERSLSRRRPHE